MRFVYVEWFSMVHLHVVFTEQTEERKINVS